MSNIDYIAKIKIEVLGLLISYKSRIILRVVCDRQDDWPVSYWAKIPKNIQKLQIFEFFKKNLLTWQKQKIVDFFSIVVFEHFLIFWPNLGQPADWLIGCDCRSVSQLTLYARACSDHNSFTLLSSPRRH